MYLHLGDKLLDKLGLILGLVLGDRLGTFHVLPILLRDGDSGNGSSEACPCKNLDHDGGGRGPWGRELKGTREDWSDWIKRGTAESASSS